MNRYFLLIILLVLANGYYIYSPAYMDIGSIVVLLVISMLAIVVFFTKREKEPNLKKQYLRHSTLVIFGFAIVHFQYHIDFLAGHIHESYYYIWVNDQIVVRALAISVSGLICFLIGYLLNQKGLTLKREEKKK